MLVWHWFIACWSWISGKTPSSSKALSHLTIFEIIISGRKMNSFCFYCHFVCSGQYTFPSQHGETTLKFSLWQGYLSKLTAIMIQQHVGWISKVWNLPPYKLATIYSFDFAVPFVYNSRFSTMNGCLLSPDKYLPWNTLCCTQFLPFSCMMLNGFN